jgi:uncharacterized SAM-binding protein YcdF (DUF218 family)
MKQSEHGGVIFRLILFMMFLLVAGGLYLVRHPLLRMAGQSWEVDDRLEQADAILMLGDDNYAGERASRSAELLRAGWAPVIVASGRLLRSYAGMAELMTRDLEAKGIPREAIVPFPHRAASVRQEAEALRALVVERGWRRVLLVTSNYDSRRKRYVFRKVFPPDVMISVVAVRDADFDPELWWESRQARRLFLRETTGYLSAVWEWWRESNGAANPATPASVGSGANPPALRTY